MNLPYLILKLFETVKYKEYNNPDKKHVLSSNK
jgi:hypothetical protein